MISLLMRNKLIQKLLTSPIGLRITKGGFWSVLGNFLSKAVLLLSTIIVAHILGKNTYGEYSIIRTTIFMFIALASVGVGSLTTKYISQYRYSNIQKSYNIFIVSSAFSIILGIIIVVLLFFLAPWIAANQLNNSDLAISLRYGALLLFFCTINAAQSGVLMGFEDFKQIAKNTFFSSIIELLSISILSLKWGINGALIGSAAGYIFLSVLNNFHIKRHFGNFVKFNLSDIKRDEISVIWVYGLPAALCNLLVILALWLSRTYLVRETDFGEIAIYNASDQIKTFILFIPMSLSAIVLPILTNIKYSSTDNKSYNKILKYNILLNVCITLIFGIFISLFANPILCLWGKGFDKPLPLIILCISAVFTSFATVVGQAIASQGKMWAGFIFNLIWAILVIGLSYYFIKKGFAATGLALAIMIAYLIHSIYQYIYLKYLVRQ